MSAANAEAAVRAPVTRGWDLRLPSYRSVLSWTFALSSSVRVLSYVPTLWAIHVSGDSTQHSLWTWCTWLLSNLTMAAWLYEGNGRRVDRAVLVNFGNAAMCLATVLLIAAYRWF